MMTRYGMLDHIREHSVMVARVADCLLDELAGAGIALSRPLVIGGALLHDIGKTACLQTGGDHAKLGRDICLANQFDELADIVAQHVVLRNGSAVPDITETALVYYADKRVTHDTIVDLDDRLAYIIQRYGQGDPDLAAAIRLNFSRCQALEKQLFAASSFPPEQLARQVGSRPERFWEDP